MISIFKRLSFSSEKWKGDCSGKSLCGKQTAQWPLRRVPMGVSPPRNESAGRVTLLSLLPLQVLAGCNTRYDFSGYVETLHSSELMKKLQTLVPKRGPSVGAGAELRVFTVSEWRFRVRHMTHPLSCRHPSASYSRGSKNPLFFQFVHPPCPRFKYSNSGSMMRVAGPTTANSLRGARPPVASSPRTCSPHLRSRNTGLRASGHLLHRPSPVLFYTSSYMV